MPRNAPAVKLIPSVSLVLRGLVLLSIGAMMPLAGAAELGNLVFLDADGDGLYDAGELGVSGVTVQLYDPGVDGAAGGGDDALKGTTTTDSSGLYSFTGLAAGNYFLTFVLPSGKVFALQNVGADDSIDSDADAAGQTAVTNLTASEVDDSWDCGLVDPATVGNLVFVDADADGLFESGESGLNGVTVRLFDNDTATQVGSTLTNDSGVYLFSTVRPGNYYISVDLTGFTGYAYTTQDQGSDDTIDSDVDGTGKSAVFTLTAGATDTSRDAGVYKQASISGQLFYDTDGDGIRETTDGNISAYGNATIRVFSAGADKARGGGDDAQVGGDVNASSTFSITGLNPTWYYVQVVPPGSLSLVVANRGSDDTVDSDINSNGYSNVFQLTSGQELKNFDAGMSILSTVGDLVWADTDEDGIKDAGESGIGNALVFLYEAGADNAAGTGDDTLMGTYSTDSSGAYQFNVVAGDYYVQITPPNGYWFTKLDQGGDDTLDSDVDPASGRTAVFALASDTTDNTRDAGVVADADNDGTPDSSDNCPNDPGKTEPGQCGCGKSDADSDGDGVLNCFDNCPTVANASQTDSDGDGVGDACELLDEEDGSDDTADGTTPDLPREDDEGTDGDGTVDTVDELQEAFPNCGACGAVGVASYMLTLVGYGAVVGLRRRRK